MSLALTLPSLGLPLARAGEISVTAESRPELRLADLKGRDWELDELRGKVVLVNFWASWCSPCLEEMPSIQRLSAGLRGQPFAVIGVNVGESQGRVKAVAKQLGIDFPVLLDSDGAVFQRWGGGVLPTSYVLDQDGVVRFLGRGPLEWDGTEAVTAMEGLLQREPVADPAHQ